MNKVDELARMIRLEACSPVRFMEVCGGHTLAINQLGIRSLLPLEISLLSGPGCPVCVTGTGYIDSSMRIGSNKEVIITTFGDLMRVPGSNGSLETGRASGMDIRMVLSPLQAIQIARQEAGRQVVFLGIGFETTAPGVAAAISLAQSEHLDNFSVLSAHKVMPPAMDTLTVSGNRIDGFICPGHVSTITGSSIYEPLAKDRHIPCVISGFEAADILETILRLLRQVNRGVASVEIQYTRAVRPEGNPKALQLMNDVFYRRGDWWRGLGIIPESGLGIRDEFRNHDAEHLFGPVTFNGAEPAGCSCGLVLTGRMIPSGCRLFGSVCTPDSPAGACMVSSEGACQTYYRFSQ
ncbi:MAG: hydrogenase formation protein HypD [Bacteroidota bacterium]